MKGKKAAISSVNLGWILLLIAAIIGLIVGYNTFGSLGLLLCPVVFIIAAFPFVVFVCVVYGIIMAVIKKKSQSVPI